MAEKTKATLCLVGARDFGFDNRNNNRFWPDDQEQSLEWGNADYFGSGLAVPASNLS
jgi:hypothetical protein